MKTSHAFVAGIGFGILATVASFALHAYFALQIAKPLGALHVLAITIGTFLFVGSIAVHMHPKIEELLDTMMKKTNL